MFIVQNFILYFRKEVFMHRICVYIGTNKGAHQEYQQAARDLAQEMVRRGIGLVYGGGRLGLMGVIADAIMEAGGEVIGVIPGALVPTEVANENLTQLIEVGSMHERKAIMADLADGFIAMPGGFGTLDELFEIVTWAQLGIHHKPVGLLNVLGFYDPLLAMVQHLVKEGFVSARHAGILLHKDNPVELLDCFATFAPPLDQGKWSDLKPEQR
jgi:uncharacterized protein (TIGR00730 family)